MGETVQFRANAKASVTKRGSRWFMNIELELPFKLRAKIAPHVFRHALAKVKYQDYKAEKQQSETAS